LNGLEVSFVPLISPGTPASSTTKTAHHDIAESGVKHNKSNQNPKNTKWEIHDLQRTAHFV
jgi:hypothetical protein